MPRNRSRSRERERGGGGRGRDRRGYEQNQSYGNEYDRHQQYGGQGHGHGRGQRQNYGHDDRSDRGHQNNYDYDRGGGGGYRGGGRREDEARFQEDEWPIRGGGNWGQSNGVARDPNQRQGHYRDRDRDYDRGGGGGREENFDRRNRGGNRDRHDDRVNRNRGHGRRRDDEEHERAEQHRIEMGNRYPHHTFLEQVDLPLEYAFRLDTKAERVNMSATRGYAYNQTPSYSRTYYPNHIFGAPEEYTSKLPGDRRCKPKLGIDEFGNVVDAQTEKPIESEDGSIPAIAVLDTTPKPNRKASGIAKPVQFLSLSSSSKESAGSSKSGRINFGNSLNLAEKKSGNGVYERAEKFNVQLRQDPKNINLWREFVQFQDQYFEETNQGFDGEDDEDGISAVGAKKKKNKAKGRKKALIEKKIAVLENALASNPKSIELCVDKLDLVYEIYKPTYVLMEWRKLSIANQEMASFWFEYLRFASTQLQLFTSSSVIQIFEKTIEKFRTMLTPIYQAFQRPLKSHLVLADLFFSICILLRNAGFTERSVAIHQAQLEMDFHFVPPTESKEDWKQTIKRFGEFWKVGTLHYGESGSLGWKNQTEANSHQFPTSELIPDSQVSKFEDDFFSSLTDIELESSQQKPDSVNWLYIESLRSKLYWVTWRALKDAEADSSDDDQRIVIPTQITPFLSNISRDTYSSDFEQQSVYFRHLIHFLLTLREDFLPRTHTLDSIMSPFANYALSDSRTLFSEIYYWKKFLNFYHKNSSSGNEEEEASDIPVPEGFRLNEFTVTCQADEIESALKLIPRYTDTLEETKSNLLRNSEANHRKFVRSVVEQSLDHLDTKFATVLVQSLLRFEQRNTYNSKETHKSRMKFVKNLMKHEKLRSSAGAYGELAMVEYFGGSKEKAYELLIKTINSSGNSLHDCESEKDLEKVCDLVAEITRLYKMLVECHLRESPEKALAILISLGNKFSAVDLTAVDVKPNTNALLKAKKFFEFVQNWLLPDLPKTADDDDVQEVERGFEEKLKGNQCVEFLLQDTNLIVEWTTVHALFRFLSADFESANELYIDVMEKTKPSKPLSRSTRYDSSVIFRHHIREQLYINWSKLSALVLSTSPMQNSKFRSTLCNALQDYPSSPQLLLLFTDVESQCSIVGKLWRAMVSIVKQDSSHDTVSLHWTPLFMTLSLAQQIERLERDEAIGLDSFGLGGPAVPPDTIFYKLDALLTAAQTNTLSRNVPLIWRIHLKHLVMRANQGKDVMRARALFYDAIRHCPSSKALYMDGIAYFPDMTTEISDLMTEKGILVRLPREELDLLMEIDNELENEVMEVEKQKKAKDVAVVIPVSREENIISTTATTTTPKSSKRKKPETDSGDNDIILESESGPVKRQVDPTKVVDLSDGEIDD